MAATTLDRLTDERNIDGRNITPFLVDASVAIPKGTKVSIDTTTGYLVVATDAANRRFVGVTEGSTDGTETVDTDIVVYRDGEYDFGATSIAATAIGAPMYVVDNQTFDETVANYVMCGQLAQYVSTTRGWLDIGRASILTAAATAITFSGAGATLVHETALAAANVQAGIIELQEEVDDHICNDGTGTATVSPGADAEHFAGAVVAWTAGVAHYIEASAEIAAEYLGRSSGETGGIPTFEPATNTTGTRPATLFFPVLVANGANGWGYKYYMQASSTIVDSSLGAIGDPVYRGAAGIPTILRPAGTNKVQVVGRFCNVNANADVQIDFDDEILEPHTHEDEAEGQLLVANVQLQELTAFTKDGASHTVITQDFESLYACTVVSAYASLTTGSSHADTVVLTLNGSALCFIANGAKVGEAKALAIDIAAATNFLLAATANAGDAAVGLSVTITYRRNTV